MAARIESHVTVIYELTEVARIAHVVHSTPALRLRIGGPALWEADVPGIYLAIEDPHGDLARFRSGVLGTATEAYRPHVTILHRDSVSGIDQVSKAWSSVRHEEFDVEFIAHEIVVYEQTDDVWHGAARLRFA